jgi:MFS transporter, BCD family, chlorophyll transporter
VLTSPATGYSFVYHIELFLIIVALVIVGPMAKFNVDQTQKNPKKLGFTDLPT